MLLMAGRFCFGGFATYSSQKTAAFWGQVMLRKIKTSK